MNRKLTMSEIKALNQQAGFKTFNRQTMKFFGETARNYTAGGLTEDGKGQYFYRNGGRCGYATFVFDFATCSCRKVQS